MATLTPEQIFQACVQAGFSPDQAVTATAIAMAESGGRSDALNPNGEHSMGLFQINCDPEAGLGERMTRWGDLNDPVNNARAAYEISGHGTNLRPWTTTHDSNKGTAHDYRNFMDEARAAGGGAYMGNFDGVRSYRDPDPGGFGDPTGGGQPAEITETAAEPPSAPPPAAPAPPPAVDSDADGATDAYEMEKGTDPQKADSDFDGLSDGFEFTLGSDPLKLDTDGDGLSDSYEVQLGTSPIAADTDGDGVTDDLEAVAEGGTRAPRFDVDDDGLANVLEVEIGTSPYMDDSDLDGTSDLDEVTAGTDPLQAEPGTDPTGAIAEVAATVPGANPSLGLGGVLSGQPGAGVVHNNPLYGMSAPAFEPGGPTANPLVGAAATPTGTNPLYAGAAANPLFAGAAATAATAPPADPAESEAGSSLQQFIDHAKAQTGDSYIFGAEAEVADDNPDTFDCSELVQWAAGQVGIDMPDGSWVQYMKLKEEGLVIPVEDAANTPGALLFSFSSEPTASGGRPSSAHVAISLGDGTTIEARGRKYGVGTWDIGERFQYAAVLPGMADVDLGDTPTAPPAPDLTTGPDSDADGAPDPFEMDQGTNPLLADSDGDGLLDGWEFRSATNALAVDTDGDGLADGQEVQLGSSAVSIDSDLDGITDKMELSVGRSATLGIGVGGPNALSDTADADGDGLSDAMEAAIGSNPNAIDSDHDGLADDLELGLGLNPADPDTDDDGFVDGFFGH